MSQIHPEVWQAAFDLIPFPVYVVDVNSYVLLATNQLMRQRIAAAPVGPCYKAIYQLHEPCIFCHNAKLLSVGQCSGELVFEHFNEWDDRWYQVQEKLIDWGDGAQAKYSIAVDISTLKAVQNELAEAHVKISLQNISLQVLSGTDRLTGLFNRHHLDETFAREAQRNARYLQALSVVMADVDKFKDINDLHGHQVGDRVLVTIADVLRQGMRKTDTLGRWGGEEFLAICPNTELEGAVQMAENLRRLVQAQHCAGVGPTTCSFGVAQLMPGEAIESLIGRADAALYLAKAGGRNLVCVDHGS